MYIHIYMLVYTWMKYIYIYACVYIHIYTHRARLQTPISCLKANHTTPLLLITYIHKTRLLHMCVA